MMSVGIGTISKGNVQQAIERVANNPLHRPNFLAALQGNPQIAGTDWIDFLRDTGGLATGDENYFRISWLQFWSKTYPVEAIVRQSLIVAINLADTHSTPQNFMPIDCYWIWTNDASKFEALITFNTRQVMRIILTPPPPTHPNMSTLTGEAPFWIVKANPVETVIDTDPEGEWITVQIKAPE
jgi:hypothetical protein